MLAHSVLLVAALMAVSVSAEMGKKKEKKKRKKEKKLKKDCFTDQRLLSVTFATDPGRAFFLLASFKKHKHDRVVCLGNGTVYEGPGQRLRLLKEYLNNKDVRDGDLMLYSDGYYAFVTGPRPEFVRRFLMHNTDILFAGRRGEGGKMLLSASGFIGRVRVLREMLARTQEVQLRTSPQEFFGSVWERERYNMKIDEERRVFCVLGDAGDSGEVQLEPPNSPNGEVRLVGAGIGMAATVYPLVVCAGEGPKEGGASHGRHRWYNLLRARVQRAILISNIQVYPPVVRRGETLFFQLTVANFNDFDLPSQSPPSPAWIYESPTSFLSEQFGDVASSFRLGIDYDGRQGIDHPYRWGLGEIIRHGNEKTVVLGINVRDCFKNRPYHLGYVFEQFFWVIRIHTENITVLCS